MWWTSSARVSEVLARCLAEGLVGGEGFAIDASVVTTGRARCRGALGRDHNP